MNLTFRPILWAALGVCLLTSQTRADEGLWLFSQPPRKLLKENYDFKLTDALLERLQKATVRVGRGGSGSFVSAEGLVLTNHHVALSWLEELRTEKKDLVETGFHAARRDQEIRCPGLELYTLWSMEDVTTRVHDAVKADMTPAQAHKARRAVIHAIENESCAKTGLASEVTELYHGGRYQLDRYKKYTDVRLVFAPGKKEIKGPPPGPDKTTPPAPVYGEYITDKFDVCFVRAYEDGKPARPAHWLPIAPSLPQQNDLVLACGFPGSTHRHRTSVELEELYGRQFLLEFKAGSRETSALEAFAKQSPENAELAKEELATMPNALADGPSDLQIREQRLAAKRAREKTDHAQLLAMDKELATRQRQALQRIEASMPAGRGAMRRLYFLDAGAAGFNSQLFTFAQYLLRATDASSEPDDAGPLSASELQDELYLLRGQFFSPKPLVKQIQIVKLAESLEFFQSQAGEDADLIEKILSGKSPEKCAADLVNGTRLHEWSVRQALLKGGKKAVLESTDPMLVLARLVDARARPIRQEYYEKVAEPCRQAHAVLHRAQEKTAAGPIYPDATNTLRLSFGNVVATSDTLGELLSQYELPKNWHVAKERVHQNTPLALSIFADVSYGNSGSPVLDREGKIVGIAATGANGSELAYNNQDGNGSGGAICARGILEVLDKVYEARELVKELGGNVRQPEKEVPDQVKPPTKTMPGPLPGPYSPFPPPAVPPSVAKRYKELVPALIKSLKDADGEVVKAVAAALGNIGADAVPALIEALQAKDKTLRAHAALALQAMGSRGEAAIPALLKALQDDDVTVRREAARALASVVQGPQPYYGPPAFPPFPSFDPPGKKLPN